MITDALQVFVAVAEHSNFSRAAESLHLSQPGVSLHIQNLEKQFGAKLVHRTPKYVRLTEAGQLLYSRAKLMLSLYEEAQMQIQLLNEVVTGTLQIGASFTIGEYLLPRLIASFVPLHPQVDIQVTIGNTEEIVQAIQTQTLDIGLVEGEVHSSDVAKKPWLEDELIMIASPTHPLAQLSRVACELLQDQIWIYREHGSGTRAYSDHFIESNQISVKRSFMLSSNQGVKEAVLAGLGLAIISRLVVEKELKQGELCALSLDERRLTRTLLMLENIDPHDTLARRVFTQHLVTSSS